MLGSCFPVGSPVLTFDEDEEAQWGSNSRLTQARLDETALLSRAMAASATEVRAACEAELPEPMRQALAMVRRRVAHDELPLLSLLQTEPLQLQSSHLSFQEYYAAKALCKEGMVLSGAPPWQSSGARGTSLANLLSADLAGATKAKVYHGPRD